MKRVERVERVFIGTFRIVKTPEGFKLQELSIGAVLEELSPGKRIKAIRQRKSMTQKMLSKLSGLDHRRIQRLESGKIDAENLTARNLLKLSNALRCDPRILFLHDLEGRIQETSGPSTKNERNSLSVDLNLCTLTAKERFKTIRKYRKMTQKALHELSGVDCRCIQRIESGETKIENLTAKKFLSLVDALKCDPYIFLI